MATDLVANVDPRNHAGVDVDPGTRALTVMSVRGVEDATLASRIADLRRAGVTVRTKVQARSRAELEELRDGLFARLPSDLLSRVFGARIDTAANRVVIDVDDPSNGVRAELRRLFGDAVSVRRGQRITLTDRYDDLAPWYGGDRILLYVPPHAYTEACSSGFGATYRNQTVMVTAGHCAPYGDVATPTLVANGATNGEGGCQLFTCPDPAGPGSFGTVWRTGMHMYADPNVAVAKSTPQSIDLAMILTSTSPYTWAAGSDSALAHLTSYPGPSRTPAGSICLSGAQSWGTCGFQVLAEQYVGPVAEEINNVTYYAKVTYYEATSTSLSVCGGDSGGTVYSHFSQGGESILGVATGTRGNVMPSIHGSPCGSNLLFTYWGQALEFYPGFLPNLTIT
jgi:hypothetical protein